MPGVKRVVVHGPIQSWNSGSDSRASRLDTVPGKANPSYLRTNGVCPVASVSRNVPLLKGTLDLLVLKTLSWGAMHGYAIATWLEQRSDGTLGIDDSALYQALQRMETHGWLSAEWGETDTGRRARFYRLTAAGRQRLRSESRIFERYASSVLSILALSSRTS